MSYDDLFVVFILSALANVIQFMAHMVRHGELLEMKLRLAEHGIDPEESK